MRKDSVSIVGVLALLGFLAFGGQAEAQVQTFENYMAWWDSLNCPRMINVVVDTGVDADATQDGGPKSTLGEFRWCDKWAALGTDADRKLIMDVVTGVTGTPVGAFKITRDADDELISSAGWWRSLDGRQQCIAIGRFVAATPCDAATAKVDNINNVNPASVRAVAMAAGEALMGGESMTESPTPTPAVPLVGLGVLGLLLAGRGAYLRRRRAA